MEGCPQAPCQFWNTWAWQSMIIQGPAGSAFDWKRRTSRRAELLHVMLEQPLDLSVDRQEATIEIQEALPLQIAVADRKRIRTAVDRVSRIDHVRPAFVALREQDHVAVAADPHVGFLGAHRFSPEGDLTRR